MKINIVQIFEFYILRRAIGYRNQKDTAEEQEVNEFRLGYLYVV